jgi:hypothetical protein
MSGYLVDLHCHTADKSFDGHVSAVEMVRGAVAAGFHGLTFTDHSAVWTAEELAAVRHEAAPPAGFFLASGQEVRTYVGQICYGDLLVFGVEEPLPDGIHPAAVFERVAAVDGGFALAPHPGAIGGFGQHLGEFPVLAAEAWNGRYGEKVAAISVQQARDAGVPVFGGSDAHQPRDIGGGATWFPRLPRSLGEIAAMLRAGEARPWKPGLLQRFGREWRS